MRDPTVDLFAVLPGTPGHTVLREARLAGDHTSYHVGEFASLRQVNGHLAGGSERLRAGLSTWVRSLNFEASGSWTEPGSLRASRR